MCSVYGSSVANLDHDNFQYSNFFLFLFVSHSLDPLVQIICTSIKSLLLGLHNCTMSNIITVHTSEHLVTRLCSYGSREIQYPICGICTCMLE